MRWQRRLRPRRPACSHRSGGRRLKGRGGGVGGWDSRGGRRPGDAPDRARLGAGGNVLGRLGRAHAPRGWAARALPQARGLVAQGGGGGKAPVTSGSRGSGREGRGSGGETTADWCTRIIHTTQWIPSSGRPRAPPGSAPATGCDPAVTPLPWWVPPPLCTLGSSRWSCGRRQVAAAAGGRGERKGDEFHYQSFTPTR